MSAAWLSATRMEGTLLVSVGGHWTVGAAPRLDSDLRRLDAQGLTRARVDLTALDTLDTTGAWLLERTRKALSAAGLAVDVVGASPIHAALLTRLASITAAPPEPPVRKMEPLARLGAATDALLNLAGALLSHLGAVTLALAKVAVRPARLRLVPLSSHLEQVGLAALPIVGLLSFLIGVVLAYEGLDVLREFGAEPYAVYLVGISALREMGILITAVVVAGRTGSTYAAQLGTMQMNEEVDALRTIGLDPVEVLVVPRVLALVIALPLVALVADLAALLGGGLMLNIEGTLSFPEYLRQLRHAVTPTTLWVGIVKAPVFGFVIALVGTFEGLAVAGSAESVGHHTKSAVVESIFLVIVLDAGFAVLFTALGI